MHTILFLVNMLVVGYFFYTIMPKDMWSTFIAMAVGLFVACIPFINIAMLILSAVMIVIDWHDTKKLEKWGKQ